MVEIVVEAGIAVGSLWAGKIAGGNHLAVEWFEGPQKDCRSVGRS